MPEDPSPPAADRQPAIRLLALSAHEDEQARTSMEQAGVSGYVVKGAPPDEVLRALTG